MLPVFADPKTDFVFKRIFGGEARKPLLIALLNHLLELEGDHRILELEHLPLEQHVDIPALKLSIVDVKCTDATGRRFVVEMQVLKIEGFEKRVVYNASKAYVMQLNNADDYPTLCDVVGVTICNFNLWTDKDEHGQHKVPMLSRWRMQEQHRGQVGLPQVQYTFLELPKYAAGNEPQTLVDKWAYFFRETRHLDAIPEALSERPFRDALEIARTATFGTFEWLAYDRAKMAEQDARGAISLAQKEARAEGHAEGRAEGKAEGHAEGKAEGHAEGRAEGEAQGKRLAILAILAARALPVTAEIRARIEACTDAAQLDHWISRAATAPTAEALLSDPLA